MANLVRPAERRRASRMSASQFGIGRLGVVRPGVDVLVLEISSRAALVESSAAIRPGARTELMVQDATGTRRPLAASTLRSWVTRLEPLRFRAVLEFDADGTG